jgi:hypothetical protein
MDDQSQTSAERRELRTKTRLALEAHLARALQRLFDAEESETAGPTGSHPRPGTAPADGSDGGCRPRAGGQP